jgi:hypothetical protein
VDPSKSKVASKCLSRDQNQLNMKKLKVNAQVTATTSFIEMSINIGFIIFVWYNKGTSYSSLTAAMISYFIILPYVFLMNTSHNKNRIVELGWKNVLMNVIGRPDNSVEPNEEMGNDKHESQASKLKKKRKSSMPPTDNNKTYISVISSNALQSNLLKDDSPSQSTSYEKRCVPEDQVKNIISSMIRCANDEEIYVEYFKKLVDFQDCQKKGTVYSDVAKEDIFLSACSPTNDFTKRPSRREGMHSASSSTELSVHNDQIFVCNKQPLDTNSINRKSLKEELKDRVTIRTEIMKRIIDSTFKDDYQHNFIEKLIDLEETFVQEC